MIHECKVKLCYIVSSMPSWVTEGDPVSEKGEKEGKRGPRKEKKKNKLR